MNILITGGTGSLGSTLVRKLITQEDVTKIIIYSRDEHKQERLLRELQTEFSARELNKLRFFIGDVRDKPRLSTAMRAGLMYVIHTAALKIVPAMEYNPQEAVKTNILGTQNVIDCAGDCGVFRCVVVSTDKAVHPINLYGASKLVAEKLTIASNNLYPHTNYDVVRYGNVACSNGSVIPLFQEAKKHGNPLKITHMDMTRFWITLDEAARFVINRTFDKYNGVRGAIYVPEMDAYHMSDLVKIFSTEGKDNIIIGVRPGEKINEQIVTDSELLRSVNIEAQSMLHDNYLIIHPEDYPSPDAKINRTIAFSHNARRIPVDELEHRINEL